MAAKDNKITVAPTVLGQFDLTGMVVTGDAMYTQRPLSTRIVEAGGDYLWLVKDNQPELRQNIEELFVPEPDGFGTGALPTDLTTARTIEKGHGRIEERSLTTSSMLQNYSRWPYLAQVFKLESTVTTALGIHTTVRYGVTSLPPGRGVVPECRASDSGCVLCVVGVPQRTMTAQRRRSLRRTLPWHAAQQPDP